MAKIKSKLSFILVILMLVPVILALTACNSGEQKEESSSEKVLTLEMNPTVSFVVDNDNKITNVSLDNEDAGNIFVDVDFVGKDVDSAIQIFIENSAITGHVNTNVTVKVGGSNSIDVTNLKNKVKAKVEETFSSLGIDANVELQDVSSEDLINKIKYLAKDYTDSELKELSYEDLIKLYNERQSYYKGLAYSQVKEIETFLNSGTLDSAIDSARTALETAQKTIEGLPDIAKETAQEQLNLAKKNFDEAVKDYKDKWLAQVETAKAKYETVKADLITKYKEAVASTKTSFYKNLDEAKESGKITQEQYDYWKNLVEQNLPA